MSLEHTYQKPESLISNLVRAPGFSQPVVNWQKTALIKAFFEETPSIEYVARPQLKLGGIRFNPQNYTAISNYYIKQLVYFDMIKKTEKNIPFPQGSILREVQWAPNGKNLIVSLEKADAQEVWLVQIPSLKKAKIPGISLNSVLGRTISWLNDEEILFGVRTKNQARALTVERTAPQGPVVQETRGQVSQNRTFADLLKTPQDEKAFAAAIETQLVIYNCRKKTTKKWGQPLLLTRFDISPNKKCVIVESLLQPFSYSVPYSLFAKKIEIWSMKGQMLHSLLKRGAAEHLPIQGTVTGPRSFSWHKNEEQTLMYVEARDQGDWAVQVEHRDEIFRMPIPSKGKPKGQSILKTKHRFAGFSFLEDEENFFMYEYERDREWVTTYLVTPQKKSWDIKVVFSLSENDDYNSPGNPVHRRDKNGEPVIAVDRKEGRHIYFSGAGASPEGERPFLRKMNLDTLETTEIFRSPADVYEKFAGFTDTDFTRFFTSYQSQTESPRFFIRDTANPAKKSTLYADPNPYAVLGKIKKEVITYKRPDGIMMSGILYYPLNYKAGTKYPAIVTAYPLEYADASTAGQVRGSPNRFAIPFHEDIVYNALRGYVVLKEAQIPIVGHPETKNDTFIEQLVAGAKSAVDALDERGLIDRSQVGVIGHSYGGFMVAHLLTHSDLFATGIAKSGAYNRTLTPFGFQGERRPFWKAKETYLKLSPFLDADKMKKPLLLMHGMADNNAGTLTMQTERYFEALKGQGAQARLVLLPEESHGYASVESIEHVLWEIFNWFDTHLKGRTK